MNMQYIGRNKKKLIIAVVVILLVAGVVGFLWQQRKTNSYHAAQMCAEYGPTHDYFDGPTSIQEMTDDSIAVVLATAEDPDMLGNSLYPDGSKPTLKIKEVLKGDARVNDVVSICAGLGLINLQPGEHPTIVLFAEGKDGNTWIPVRGSIGVVPQDKDGRFTPKGMSQEPKSVTIDELRKLAK